MPRDQEILATLTDERFTQNPGLSDIFEDIGNFATDTYNSAFGTAKEEAGKAATNAVKDLFGGGSQEKTLYPLEQYQGPPAPNQSQPDETAGDKAKSFIKKVPPVVVAGGTTVVAKYVGKFGWITSIAAGVGAGAAKYLFIDKKGAKNG